jgi:hypothetical protein
MSFGLNHPSDGIVNGTNDGVPITAIDPSTPWTAIAEGNLSLLQQSLYQLNYPICVADEIQGYTLLQAAASYNQLPILQWIWSELLLFDSINVGDDPPNNNHRPEGGYQNAIDYDGDTALHYAGSVESMKFLIETTNIDVHITNKNGMTALDTKRTEMHELEQDIDEFDEHDVEYIQLKDMVQYLESIIMNPQQS